MGPPGANQKVVYGGYVVAVLDVLGQKQAIRDLAKLHPGTADSTEIKRAIRGSIGKRNGVRDLIKSSFEEVRYKDGAVATLVLNAEQQKAYDLGLDDEIKIYGFSDTLVAYSPLVSADNYPRVSAINGILAACAVAMLKTIAAGRPVRGGIELGYGLEPDNNEVYGPAFLAAYELQDNAAQYPRIVVGPTLASYLRGLMVRPMTSLRDQYLTKLVETSLRLISPDEDGCLFVDYLGDEFRQVFETTPIAQQLVAEGLAFARREHARFIKESDQKLAGRYAALRRYFECKAPAWRKQE